MTQDLQHLQTLRMIQAVARAGSIRRAAEDMHITSSALNRRIQNFEADFGAQVFERLPYACSQDDLKALLPQGMSKNNPV